MGLTLTENFYWNLNDRTRGWYERIKPMLPSGTYPNMMHAGDYAATLHYLKAVKEIGIQRAKASGRETVATMKRMPTDDDCFGVGRIREDGRKLHPSYLFQVKPPSDRTSPGDVYRLLATTAPDDAFRPLTEGGCPMVKG
jgi:branched-chain amino acid transport system substrate-binding protein